MVEYDKKSGLSTGVSMVKIGIVGIVFAICTMVMVSVGCGGGEAKVNDPTPVNFGSGSSNGFAEYGFSFEYPKDFGVRVDGLIDEVASEDSGLIQITPNDEDDFPIFALSWVKTWASGLEGGLDAGFEGIGNWEGIVSIEQGDLVETTKSGRRMLYQAGHRLLYKYYTATTEFPNEIIYGIVGTYYCEDSKRQFSLVTMNDTTKTPSLEDAVEQFEDFLDTLVCH